MKEKLIKYVKILDKTVFETAKSSIKAINDISIQI